MTGPTLVSRSTGEVYCWRVLPSLAEAKAGSKAQHKAASCAVQDSRVNMVKNLINKVVALRVSKVQLTYLAREWRKQAADVNLAQASDRLLA